MFNSLSRLVYFSQVYVYKRVKIVYEARAKAYIVCNTSSFKSLYTFYRDIATMYKLHESLEFCDDLDDGDGKNAESTTETVQFTRRRWRKRSIPWFTRHLYTNTRRQTQLAASKPEIFYRKPTKIIFRSWFSCFCNKNNNASISSTQDFCFYIHVVFEFPKKIYMYKKCTVYTFTPVTTFIGLIR